jgi:hypothetical protein
MMSKFEQLLDYLVNEDHEKANELFHEIVVEKSREIYENLIAEEESEDEEKNEDESMEEAFGDDEDAEAETVESMFGEVDDEDDNEFPVQDPTDNFKDDVSDDEFGEFGDEGDDMDGDMNAPADKGDIMDLEDAIEELKAEFEALLGSVDADKDGDHDMDDHEMSDDDADKDDKADMDGEEPEDGDMGDDEDDKAMKFEGRMTQGERMREYIEKVTATMDGGLVGARTGETMSGPKEGKSPISSGSGKPTSGATAKNIATDHEKHSEDGQKPHGKVGGLVKTGGQFVGSGTKNVAGSASAKKPDGAKLDSVKKPGNKEGEGWGAGKGDKAGQTGGVIKHSPLSGAPGRAK